MNISSIVIQAKAQYIPELVALCQASDVCDYHFHDESIGKIIVTIEGANIEEEMAKLKQIQAFPHVVTADMMMAYSEEELDSVRSSLVQAPRVPEVLNDESVKFEDIVYHGDLKKKIH